MAKVTLTANLKKYYPEKNTTIEGGTVLEVLQNMEEVRPHFMSYILEDNNHVRKHVNIFVDGKLIDKSKTDTKINPETQLHIMQALSGG